MEDADGGDIFGADGLEDLAKEFNMDKNDGKKKSDNPFGQSITKELLQQSKKEIDRELHGLKDEREDAAKKSKKPKLEIDIDDGADFEQQDAAAHQLLNDKVQENEKRMAQGQQPEP